MTNIIPADPSGIPLIKVTLPSETDLANAASIGEQLAAASDPGGRVVICRSDRYHLL